MYRRTAIAALGILLASAGLARGQAPAAQPYDGIQAGLDAYRLAEERRRGELQQQLDVNAGLRAWSGLPPLYGETIWYRNPAGFGPAVPPEAWYLSAAPYPYGPRPWSLVAGPGWDASFAVPARQPVGRWEGQTGPNRWESHPVYDPPLTPYLPSPPVASPWLDRTPYAAPRPYYANPPVRQTPPAVDHRQPATEDPLAIPADEFDTPRELRESAEPIAPATPKPSGTPRTREF
jgi:hypothetical protein